jgi:hypothetical protein
MARSRPSNRKEKIMADVFLKAEVTKGGARYSLHLDHLPNLDDTQLKAVTDSVSAGQAELSKFAVDGGDLTITVTASWAGKMQPGFSVVTDKAGLRAAQQSIGAVLVSLFGYAASQP